MALILTLICDECGAVQSIRQDSKIVYEFSIYNHVFDFGGKISLPHNWHPNGDGGILCWSCTERERTRRAEEHIARVNSQLPCEWCGMSQHGPSILCKGDPAKRVAEAKPHG